MFNTPGKNNTSVIKSLLISLVINVGVPFLLLYLLTTYTRAAEIVALGIASIVPILNSILELARNRRLDLIALLFLLGVLTNIVAIFMGGSAQILIIRESFYTGAPGLFCIISLFCLPRPLMFYIGRQMLTGTDPVKVSNYNASWQNSYVRFAQRLITTVWGCTLVEEFIVRAIIAYTLPFVVAYGLGSTIFVITMVGTFVWTFAYIRHVRRRSAEMQQRQLQQEIVSG